MGEGRVFGLPRLRDRGLLIESDSDRTSDEQRQTDTHQFRGTVDTDDIPDSLPDEIVRILANAPQPKTVLNDHPQLRDPSTPHELLVNYAVEMAEASDRPLEQVFQSEPVINYARSMGIDGDVYRRATE